MPLAGSNTQVPVRVVNHVVEIGDALLLHELAQDVHVAVRLGVRGEDVVVGDDDDLVAVPDLRVLAELALEHADGARPADVVGHQDVGLHPDVVAGLHPGFAGRAREYFFSQCHTALATYLTGTLSSISNARPSGAQARLVITTIAESRQKGVGDARQLEIRRIFVTLATLSRSIICTRALRELVWREGAGAWPWSRAGEKRRNAPTPLQHPCNTLATCLQLR